MDKPAAQGGMDPAALTFDDALGDLLATFRAALASLHTERFVTLWMRREVINAEHCDDDGSMDDEARYLAYNAAIAFTMELDQGEFSSMLSRERARALYGRYVTGGEGEFSLAGLCALLRRCGGAPSVAPDALLDDVAGEIARVLEDRLGGDVREAAGHLAKVQACREFLLAYSAREEEGGPSSAADTARLRDFIDRFGRFWLLVDKHCTADEEDGAALWNAVEVLLRPAAEQLSGAAAALGAERGARMALPLEAMERRFMEGELARLKAAIRGNHLPALLLIDLFTATLLTQEGISAGYRERVRALRAQLPAFA